MRKRCGIKGCPELSAPNPEAKKRAAVVLEVLGGLSSPAGAAATAGISLPRYYALEKAALEGLVAACAPDPRRGRRASPERETERLKERVKQLEREASRNLAMFRAARRAAGLAAPAMDKVKPSGRKRRRPVARALVAAESLRGTPAGPPAGAGEV